MTEFAERLDMAARTPRGLTYGPIDRATRRSWSHIRQDAAVIAGALGEKRIGLGDTVAVLVGESVNAAGMAQALWYRRAALTMLQQPTAATTADMWADSALHACRVVTARYCVFDSTFHSLVHRVASQLYRHGIEFIHVDDLRKGTVPSFAVGGGSDADIAMRQLTSGSTSAPKAVSITCANLAANTDALYAAIATDPESDTSLSWLPLSHDMGMVAFLIGPMLVGGEAVVVAPEVFLRDPANWARLIERHHATITCGPNFAYRILARSLDRLPDGAVDLRSLRVAINGAEPIHWQDVEHLLAAGSRFGLRRTAMTPAYGMAEATLAITFSNYNDTPRFDTVSQQALTNSNHAEPLEGTELDAPDVVSFTSVGRPVTGMSVRIRDERGNHAGIRTVGRIEIRGPAIAANYTTVSGPEPIPDDEGWFDTGDLGYHDEDGDLYICGRAKDLIIINGKNLYPADIERAAAEVPDVRRGGVAAVRFDNPGASEGFAVLAETDYHPTHLDQNQVANAIAHHIVRRIGYRPRHVQLLPAGTLPKTPSGKLRRHAARALIAAPDSDRRPHSDTASGQPQTLHHDSADQ